MELSSTLARARIPGSVPPRGRGASLPCATPLGAIEQLLRFILLAVLVAVTLPAAAWAGGHCESINGTAAVIRNCADVRAFVECAYDSVMHNGPGEEVCAFREDERWRSDSIYLFVDKQSTTGSDATSSVFPPNTAREGQSWGPLVDEFGTDYFVEATRPFGVVDEDPARGLDWNGTVRDARRWHLPAGHPRGMLSGGSQRHATGHGAGPVRVFRGDGIREQGLCRRDGTDDGALSQRLGRWFGCNPKGKKS